ncbi:MAG: CPBP family intramembrane metalloprotease [Tannerella sp.]|nr:CPBP family intramembrane metalloprotease [Tannerella sp.]
MIFAGCISITLDSVVADPAGESVWMLQLTEALSSICVFLIPSLCTAWLCSDQSGNVLPVRSMTDVRMLSLVTLATLLIMPFISLTGYLNTLMHLPDALSSVEAWMREMEDLAASVVGKLMSVKGTLPFLANLLVIALLAGLTEEFMFRGALLSILRKGIRNPHVAIWLVAVIFSAIHCQFYGFLPRMLLGAYLGYLLYWTKNLWLAVFAHFLNNAVAVIALSNDSLKTNPLFSDEILPGDAGWISIVAAIGLVFFAACMTGIYRLGRQKA